jgi:hypothetical protein
MPGTHTFARFQEFVMPVALADGFPLQRSRMRAAGWPACSVTKTLGVKPKLADGAAESIAVHA